MAALPFAWPDVVVRAAWVLLATGFLVVLLLTWYRPRDPHRTYYMANDPVLDPLRADPRFAKLRQRFRIQRERATRRRDRNTLAARDGAKMSTRVRTGVVQKYPVGYITV